MEASSDVEITTTAKGDNSKKKGGLRTMPFIIANEAFEKVASFGLLPNMILYLMKDYRMDVPTGTTFLSFWGAGTNFLPVLGAFVSDCYFGRYPTIIFGCIASFAGMLLLWLTAMIPQVRPPPCDSSTQTCETGVATTGQLFVLISAFVLMSIGAGGIRPCSLAFGADQVNGKDNPNNKRVLQTFFNWYYASSTVSVLIAMTVIVYIQDHFGWKLGFGVPATIMLLSGVSFVLASPLYVRVAPNKTLFYGFAYASVAAFRNRHITLPGKDEGLHHHELGSPMVVPTERLRFLNKACLIQNREKDLCPDGSVRDTWSLCTVEQVEGLKALIKVLPIWSTGIFLSATMSVPSFPLLQTNSLDRHLTKNFEIPAGSFGMFTIATLTIWLGVYDRLLIPLIAKITGKPYGFGLKTRMGIGLALSIAGSAVSAIVESVRRSRAINQGFADKPEAVLDMSAFWLLPQLCIGGVAEAFNAVGQTEFYYSQFPKSMSSIASALFGLGMAFGNMIVGVLVKLVDRTTKKGGISWVSGNLNRAHYDYYYWLLVFIGSINFVYFLVCCWAYGPCGESARIESKDSEDDSSVIEGKHKEIEMTK